MPTPPKPIIVLTTENKSHRTKAEKEQRKKAEESLETGVALKERPEVKSNKIAHKEFSRVSKLLENIQKNDALYETIINRYCVMIAECADMQEKKDRCYQILEQLNERFDEEIDNSPPEERAKIIRSYSKSYNESLKSLFGCDAAIQTKRKMLLDIEKENIMTIASALRSIPKKVNTEEEDDKMKNILSRKRG